MLPNQPNHPLHEVKGAREPSDRGGFRSNHHHEDASGEHVHMHGTVSYDEPQSRYRWQIYHPFEDIHHQAAIEVAPWQGLLPRWRFIIPSDYEGVVRWGVGPPGATDVSFENVRRPVRHGPVQLVDGPEVEWLGGHNPLSSSLSAYIIIDGEPPHYLAFGQAEEPEGPPGSLEGIYFKAHDHG